MKNVLVAFSLFFGLASCGKKFVENEEEKYYAENKAEIESYIAANNIDVIENVRTGIFFKILNENPDAAYPTADDAIHLSYTMKNIGGGELLNVSSEDSSFFSYAASANIFEGFVIAVNSLREGEKGVFYIPSPLAFAGNPPSNFALKAWGVLVLEVESLKIYSESDFIDLYIKRLGLTEPEVTELGVRIFREENRPEDGDLAAGDLVTVKYKGYLLNGDVFDEGEFDFTLGAGGLIAGFEDGIAQMRVGEKATIIIPWEHAYGTIGSQSGSIPGRSTLAFDLEIVSKN